MSEKEIFEQKISEEEMNSVAGGSGESNDECDIAHQRDIYAGGFPNCAATVEKDSWCANNDACAFDAVEYTNMKDCSRAWE